MQARLRLLLVALAAGPFTVAANSDEPLPEPLSLAAALAFADSGHPALTRAQAELERSRAEWLAVDADGDAYVGVIGELRAVEPSSRSTDPSHNDSSAQLKLRRRLYDFGYSDHREAAAEAAYDGQQFRFVDAQQRRQLEIMERFFDVILADLSFVHDNEEMATTFVAVDKARDRSELGQVSDVELFRLESRYQQSRSRRYASEARQRATRARLALALNRPGELPSDVQMPQTPSITRERPPYETLLAEVLAANPRLQALRVELRGADSAVKAARQAGGPVLHAEAGAGVWNRETRSTFPVEGGLVLEVPLYRGQRDAAERARARAKQLAAQSRLAAAEYDIREQVLGIWLDLETLAIEWEQVNAEDAYRELYLDRSRALYELEVTTDLGDAMVATSAVRRQRAEIAFRWLLTQARVAALRGQMPAAVVTGETTTDVREEGR